MTVRAPRPSEAAGLTERPEVADVRTSVVPEHAAVITPTASA